MLKSYGPDLPYAERFLTSLERFAQDDIPLYVVVPDADVADFNKMVAGRGEVLPESLWEHHLVSQRIHGNSPGYVNQEIIKLSFYEQELLENYLCVDSEAVFIRPFGIDEFMVDAHTPYTFVTEDSELSADPQYEKSYGRRRRESLAKLRNWLDLPTTPIQTCHNMAVFSSVVLESLSAELDRKQMSYADAMQLCPYEFSWYNFWLEKSKVIPRMVREPIFLMVHMEHQHLEYALKGASEADFARGYVGLLVNSGFSRNYGLVDFHEPLPQVLGRYVRMKELISALWHRSLKRAPRVRRMLHL